MKENEKINTLAKFENFSNLGEALEFAKALIGTPAIPSSFTEPEAVVSVLTMGKELGFKPLIALNNINVIKGKMVLSVHMLGAMLKQQGIDYQIIKDFEPDEELDVDGKPKIVTIIRFFWKSKVTGTVLQHDHKFSWKEAQLMGLHEKPTYQSMPRIMLRNRCLSMG